MIKEFQGEYRWLSNMWRIEPFTHEGITYDTTEAFYVSMKTMNIAEREKIAKMNPYEAKKYGDVRADNIVLRPNWDSKTRIMYMTIALDYKFSQPKMQELLLSTGTQEIVEGNRWGDTFWGVCNGKGSNHLGKLLMQKRAELASNKLFTVTD